MNVRELRLVVTADNYEETLLFYRRASLAEVRQIDDVVLLRYVLSERFGAA